MAIMKIIKLNTKTRKMVVEKLHVEPKLEFYVDNQSQLHIVTPHDHTIITSEDTIELIQGLIRQLHKAESNKPLTIWPWKKTKKH